MPDLTARSAIVNALAEERDAHPWIIQTPPMVALIALSALGIPPDTTTDEVRAGLALLGMFAAGWRIQPDTAADGSRDWCALLDRWDGQDWDTLHDATGASPAAAVNALAAKLEDDR